MKKFYLLALWGILFILPTFGQNSKLLQIDARRNTPKLTQNPSSRTVSSKSTGTDVSLPAYGTIPDNYTAYYLNNYCQALELTFTREQLGIFVLVFPLSGYSYPRFVFSNETNDTFEFSNFQVINVPIPNIPIGTYPPPVNLQVNVGKRVLIISKDWKWIQLENGTIYDIPVSQTVYKQFLRNKQAYLTGGSFNSATGNSSQNKINSDSKSEFPTNKHGYYTCPNCHGSGCCPHCNHGIANNPYLGGKKMICSVCFGTGKCRSCEGSGKKYGVIH